MTATTPPAPKAVSAEDARNAQWRRSTRAPADGEAVEIAYVGDLILTRNSLDPETVVVYNHAEWTAFVHGTKDGEFDLQDDPSA